MKIINSTNDVAIFKKNIHQNKNVVLDLKPNTTYSITVQPSSSALSGPLFNVSFTGKTLADSSHFGGIFWANDDVIQKTTPLGKDVRTLADIRSFQV